MPLSFTVAHPLNKKSSRINQRGFFSPYCFVRVENILKCVSSLRELIKRLRSGSSLCYGKFLSNC